MMTYMYTADMSKCFVAYDTQNRCGENDRSRGRSAGALQWGGARAAAVRPGGSAVRRLRVAESESPEEQRKREAVCVFLDSLGRARGKRYIPWCDKSWYACNAFCFLTSALLIVVNIVFEISACNATKRKRPFPFW